MPLVVGEFWRYVCAVCEVGRECEDHVCSIGCAQAAVGRSWDPKGEPAVRALELDRVARRDARFLA